MVILIAEPSRAGAEPKKFERHVPALLYERAAAPPDAGPHLHSFQPPAAALPDLASARPYSLRWHRQRMESNGFKFTRPPEPIPCVRILTEEEIGRGLALIESDSTSRVMNTAKFLLSFDVGLKIPEMAALEWADVRLDAQGHSHAVFVRPRKANEFEARLVALTPRAAHALDRLRTAYPDVPFVAFTDRGHVKRQGKEALLRWFMGLYRRLGLLGATGLSGPATYRAARNPELLTEHHREWIGRLARQRPACTTAGAD